MTVKTDNFQAGMSGTATNNFAIVPDGAGGLKISRGNVGATTQDILTIDSAGNVIINSGTFTTPNDGAWTPWSPTVLPGAGGAFANMTSAWFYKKVGRIFWYQGRINIIGAGSAAGGVTFTFPSGIVPVRDSVGVGREISATGGMLQAQILANGSTGAIFDPSNNTPIATGRTLVINGFFETTN